MTIKRKEIGQIIKGVGGVFSVKLDDGSIIKSFARGKLKLDGEIFIGDYVRINADKEGIIEEVLPRKSQLIRPYVANMDTVVIVLAPVPKPNMLLVDKLIVGACEQNVTPIICINKADLKGCDEIAFEIKKDFEGLADIIMLSASDGSGIEELKQAIKGKFVCLAGQSAVGKSSILNALTGDTTMEVGELSRKSQTGKQTTRHIEIFELDDCSIADTCGFTRLEMPLFEPAVLKSYYTDFEEFAKGCRFITCNHFNEEDCGVKRAVAEGKLSKERYDRYAVLFEDASKRWNNRFNKIKDEGYHKTKGKRS